MSALYASSSADELDFAGENDEADVDEVFVGDEVNLATIEVLEAKDEVLTLVNGIAEDNLCQQLWNLFCGHVGRCAFMN
jgi:hypothetical protein